VTICVEVRAELVGTPIWVTPRMARASAATVSTYRYQGRVLRERFIATAISRLRLSRTRRKAETSLSAGSDVEPADPVGLVGISARGVLLVVEREEVAGVRELALALALTGVEPTLVGLPDRTALLAPGHVALKQRID
jgi:hypothetical protein